MSKQLRVTYINDLSKELQEVIINNPALLHDSSAGVVYINDLPKHAQLAIINKGAKHVRY